MKMQNCFLAVALATWLCITLASVPVWAAGMTLRAGNVEGSAGASVDVALEANGAANIAALEMILVYDGAVLSFESLTPGTLGAGTSIITNSDTAGRLGISIATARSISGNGTLATARFKVAGQAGQSSPFGFENATAWEAEHLRQVQVAVEAGSLMVVGGAPNWLLFLLIGLLLLIVIMALARRRRASRPTFVPTGSANAQQQARPASGQRMVYCNNCGTANAAGSSFCANCGSALAPPRAP